MLMMQEEKEVVYSVADVVEFSLFSHKCVDLEIAFANSDFHTN
jgi:hypothetical protein